ncbi:ThiF family adenylyltransferase [Bacillus shivajii]|uniref:ThiF family adenylyltransferase n=1 Tax=Bacillus shivajii TaxID=1983719 RepID=UPI001CF9C60F|nr:ThiF family adenylyltransferase [Bacillus shivajii]UCZ54552.1 ThiF family adenylyltransferase [Bacillus shivajii]
MSQSWTRYSRQMLFKPVGEQGQRKLDESKVFIVGMGALGTVIANHLVRSGVGHVVFCDRDFVEESNLQRQMLFNEQDVQQFLPKAVAAEQALKKLNSSVNIKGHVTDVNANNVESFIDGVDVIMDGTDNFETRYLLNDVAYKHGIPFVYGGAVSSRGMNAVFLPGKTPCLRCMFPTYGGAGQTCDTIGVLSPIVDIIASMQVMEVLKILTGNSEKLRNNLASIDLWENHSFEMKLEEINEECPTCQLKQYPALSQGENERVTTLCGRDTVQFMTANKLNLVSWERKLEKVASVKKSPYLLRAVLEEGETFVLFPEGRVLVQGTENISRAKTLYAKYIGM